MDPATSGALITAIIGVSAPVTAAIWKRNSNGTGINLNGHYMKKDLCDERSSTIKEDIKEIKETMNEGFNKIFQKLEERS